MQDSSNFAATFGKSSALQLTGQLMVIAVVILVVVLVFVTLLHLYAKFFWLEPAELEATSETRRRLPGGGLDLAVLNSLPVTEVGSDGFQDGMECAVCLSDIVDGERARVLPKCNHGFHLHCINMWFQSNSTCPLCRNFVSPDYADSMSSPLRVDVEAQIETSSAVPSESINALFWGNQRDESPSISRESNGSLVIEILYEASPAMSSSSQVTIPTVSSVAEEEVKPPVATRLRSLKRNLSRETRVFPCNCTVTS